MTRSGALPHRWVLGLLGLLGLFPALVGWPGSQAAALGGTAPGGSAPQAVSPTVSPTSAPSPTATSPTTPAVSVEVAAIDPQVLDVTDDAKRTTVTARITNTSATTVTAGRTTLGLVARNMRTRADVERWTAGSDDKDLRRLAQVDLTAPLAPGAQVDVPLTVDRTARQMLADGTLVNEWGPRGLVVQFTATSTTAGTTASTTAPAEARTFLLVKSNQDIPRAPVALLAALTGPPVAPTLPAVGQTADQTPDQAARDRVAQVTAAVAPFPTVALAVDPALTTGDLPTEVLADRQVLTLPWGDPDLAALSGTGTLDLLARARQPARPDQTDVAWSVDPVDAATAAAVRASGATWLVAPSSDPPASGQPVRTLTTPDGNLTVVTPDKAVSGLFDGSTDLTPAQAQQQALALLATSARGEQGTPEPVLAVTGRDWSADADWTRDFVTALAGAPWVDLTTPTALLPANPDDLPRATVGPASKAVAGLAEVDADRRDLAQFATVTDNPDLVTDGVDQATLQVASYAWRTDPTGRQAAAAALAAAVDHRRTALRLTDPTNLTLISSASQVRINVRNDLPVSARVRVRLDPEKACLGGYPRSAPAYAAAGDSVIWSPPTTIGPMSDTPVTVPVYARANCDVTVRATLVGVDGTTAVTTSPVTFTARVKAQVENVVITVVGALLGLGLVLGVVRTVRRGQSARRGNRTTTDPVRLGVLGGETPIGGIPVARLLTPISGIPAVRRPPKHPDPPDETT